jgi:DNA mismatch repair protein MutS
MFATHYHELTELADVREGVHNLSVAAAEDGNDVVFLHNILEGPASKSYGIHVARIAGIPEGIRREASKKLRELEKGEISSASDEQLTFIENAGMNDERYARLEEKLRNIDVNVMTPVEALIKLQELKEEI